ncbi:murinoglobulin-2-like [Acomys russatus]|uniref:murinoglobulin-2-like n=1 Tax=Acomys russatus TaxID=60746 RepID=UPI0021E277E9|nr:murinoglobulin-2-like [Acomys russatus]
MWKNRQVLPCLISVLLAFLPSPSSTYGNLKYMVLVPFQLHTETPEKICLHFFHVNDTVTVRTFLQSNQGSTNLFNGLVVDKDMFHCVSFTIPGASLSDEMVSFFVGIQRHIYELNTKVMVLVKNTENVDFVQTDKPMYKPGQTVKFRIISMDKNLRPLNTLFPLAYIEDPKMNRIMQWRDINTENGFKQLSFSLSSEPIQGSYKIVIQKQSGVKKQHPFTVEEFVLPKFEVRVKIPKAISIKDEKMNVTVCGIYTYGKPVPGHVNISICHKCQHFSFEEDCGCKKVNYQLDNTGCITQEESITMFDLNKRYIQAQHFHVDAKVIEEGTGLEFSGSGTTKIEKIVTKLVFVKAESHFRHGIPFLMKVRLEDLQGTPIPNEQVFFKVQSGYSHATTTDHHGLAEFSINTTGIGGHSLSIKVYHKEEYFCRNFPCIEAEYGVAHHVAYSVYSISKSYVYIEKEAGILPCSQSHTVQAHFILRGTALRVLRELSFYYLVVAQGKIIQTGSHTHHLEARDPGNSPEKGNFTLEIPVEFSMAPVAKLLIYTILPDGEVIADSVNFEIEKCLLNKVDLSFKPDQSLPASQAHLHVTASPQSLCGLRAVDQSVLLLKPEAELSPSWIYNLREMLHKDSNPSSHELPEDEDLCVWRGDKALEGITHSAREENEKDVYEYLDHYAHLFRHDVTDYEMLYDGGATITLDPLAGRLVGKTFPSHKKPQLEDSVAETIRKYFPETWIWDLVIVNSSGVADMEVTVPDTITEWKARALCLSNDTGLGLSPVVSLQAFQPFFVALTMPYSVIRGEAFTLKATVQNYLPSCIRVSVELEASPDFTAAPVVKDQDSYCLCANGRHTKSWLVTPKSLGNVNFSVTAEARQSPEACGSDVPTVPETGKRDTVVKVLIVEPEGIKKEHTFSSLFCASDAVLSENLSLVLPPTVVTDSARAHFSVLGDILGSAIKNTQNLLHMPYGCGEQNMVLFAPNIYVLKYLNETQQLTQKIKSKAIDYLNAGYQRELNYKHKDGSYSAFGDEDGQHEGNTWLTAFVLKSFAQAREFIFIDEKHITDAFKWLSQQQQDHGCFRSSGWLFNNAMKGGVEEGVTLSAYITIALLESSLPDAHPVVSRALTCLDSSWKTMEQRKNHNCMYTKALLAYAFTLAGNQDKRKEILKSLDDDAIEEGNSIHWGNPEEPRKSEESLYELRAPSPVVEMNAYILLALVAAQPAPSPEDVALAMRLVKWLTKQQNSYGGFSSTQDTVVALHALSKYGALTFSRSQKMSSVTIQSSGTFSHKFQVEDSNRLLLQQVPLPDIPGEYKINMTGEGCVYAQTTLRYNVHLEKQQSAFALHVQTVPLTCDNPQGQNSFQILLEISYTGSRPASNMVIADVKMVSGFIPLKPTVKKLERSEHVSRTEVSNNNVLLYVDQVTNQTLAFSFIVQQDIPVRNLQPAIVKVYDYYETNEVAFAEYSAPCSTDTEKDTTAFFHKDLRGMGKARWCCL